MYSPNRAIFSSLIMLMLFLGSAAISNAAPVVISGPIVNPNNGHTYYLLSSDTWTASQAAAVSLGGNLVTINDAAEQTWVFGTFAGFGGGTNRFLWIGLNDVAAEGTFVWVSGEPLGFTNWVPGEPNNNMGNEDYVAMYPIAFSNGQWNDFNNGPFAGFESSGVVEVAPVPEPTTMLLLGSGLTGIVIKVRKRRKVV
jgi:Lectin C-type domain/PEP-CTERM motif